MTHIDDLYAACAKNGVGDMTSVIARAEQDLSDLRKEIGTLESC